MKRPLVTVGALVFNSEGEALFLKSHKWHGLYGIPAGKVEYGEKLIDALRREIKEETGLEIYDIRFLTVQEIIRDPDFFMDQHFVSVNYTCKTEENRVVLNDEAEEFLWALPENALKIELNSPTRELVEIWLKEKGKKNDSE